MQTFQIVQSISSSRRRVGGDVNRKGQMVNTLMAVVNFGMRDPEPQTRHLVEEPVTDEKGRVTGHRWVGYNSDRMLGIREGILESHERHEAWVKEVSEHIGKLNASMAELKGKRGFTAKRAQLKEALKTAKATLAVAKGDLEKITPIAKKVDETHPEIVAFV